VNNTARPARNLICLPVAAFIQQKPENSVIDGLAAIGIVSDL